MSIKLPLSLAILSLTCLASSFAGTFVRCTAQGGSTFEGGKTHLNISKPEHHYLKPKNNKKGMTHMDCFCEATSASNPQTCRIFVTNDTSQEILFPGHTVCNGDSSPCKTTIASGSRILNLHWRVNKDNRTVDLKFSKY
jgi:hypothetical protein